MQLSSHWGEKRAAVTGDRNLHSASRIVHAPDGIGTETLPRELPMAAGQQVSNPYRDGIHPMSMSGMAHLSNNEPTNINTARGSEQQGTTPNGQPPNMTNLVRTPGA